MKNVCLEIPRDVDYILKKLGEAGHEAYAVGGCVRDALLGRMPNDWDITTSALPAEVKQVFRRTVDTGLQHGTITVLLQEGQYEVTTYRIDGVYEDSRHPKEVIFTSNLTEDLRRRDFTINAMAYHPEVGIVDPYDGMLDLEGGVIRAVGDARERFDEDALRIMRAVRFSAQLGFAIDPETALALKEFAPRLKDISHERVRDELLKLITAPYPETFEVLYNMKITREIFPRFDMMMEAAPEDGRTENYGMATLFALEDVSSTATMRLATLLLHAGDASYVKEFLREMRLDNKTIHDVTLLVSQAVTTLDNLASSSEISEYDVRILMNKVGELMPSLIELMKADSKSFVLDIREIILASVLKIEELYGVVLDRGDCVNLKELAVTGGDLIAAGIKPGPELGEILGKLLDEVLRDPAANTKEHLLEYTQSILLF